MTTIRVRPLRMEYWNRSFVTSTYSLGRLQFKPVYRTGSLTRRLRNVIPFSIKGLSLTMFGTDC